MLSINYVLPHQLFTTQTMNQHGSNSSSGPPNFHLSSLETPSTVNQSSAASNVEAANTLIRGVSDVVHSRALLEVFLSRNMTEPNHVRIGRNQGSLNSLMEQHQQQQRYLSRKQQGSALGIINKADNQLTTSSKKAGEVACVPCRARGMPADHNFEVSIDSTGEPEPKP